MYSLIHLFIYFFFLAHPVTYLSIYLSNIYLYNFSTYLSKHACLLCMYVCMYVYMYGISIYLSIYLSISFSIYLIIYLAIYQSIHLSGVLEQNSPIRQLRPASSTFSDQEKHNL